MSNALNGLSLIIPPKIHKVDIIITPTFYRTKHEGLEKLRYLPMVTRVSAGES